MFRLSPTLSRLNFNLENDRSEIIEMIRSYSDIFQNVSIKFGICEKVPSSFFFSFSICFLARNVFKCLWSETEAGESSRGAKYHRSSFPKRARQDSRSVKTLVFGLIAQPSRRNSPTIFTRWGISLDLGSNEYFGCALATFSRSFPGKNERRDRDV